MLRILYLMYITMNSVYLTQESGNNQQYGAQTKCHRSSLPEIIRLEEIPLQVKIGRKNDNDEYNLKTGERKLEP